MLEHIELDPPFEKPTVNRPLNRFGLNRSKWYHTEDVCKLLKISPKLYSWREKKGYYPQVARKGRIRTFTEQDIEGILALTTELKKDRNW
ncbi:unnamed protein product, partial [marine sediment metagenome]